MLRLGMVWMMGAWFLGVVENMLGGIEWLALLCLPRILRASLLFLTSSLCLSMDRWPGGPSLSLKSRLANTGASGGGWVWLSGLT